MVSWGKSNAVSHVIRATLGTYWENVCRIHQAQLYACHCAAVAVREEHLLPETGKTGEPAYFLDDPLPVC